MKFTLNRNLCLAVATAMLGFTAIVPQASAQCVAGLGGGAAQVIKTQDAGDYTGVVEDPASDHSTTFKFENPALVKDGYIVDEGSNKTFQITGFEPTTRLLVGNQVTVLTAPPLDVMTAGGYSWFLEREKLWALGSASGITKIGLTNSATGFLAYDGTYVWVAEGQTMFQISVPPTAHTRAQPALVAQYQLPAAATGQLLFDGSEIWIPTGNSIFPFDITSYQSGSQFNLGGNITQMVFDGVFLWVSEGTNANVSQFDPLKGITVNNVITPSYASGAVFDGFNLWVGDSSISALYKVRACDGNRSTVLPDTGFLKLDAPAAAIFYDGSHKWITYSNSPIISVR